MQVRWTEQSCRALDFIMTCSREYYAIAQLRQLRADITQCETLLSANPLMGAVEEELDGLDVEYRRLVLSNPFKIIYFIYEECIYIADIWDTRQSPTLHRNRLKDVHR